jgi:hypothetical protein
MLFSWFAKRATYTSKIQNEQERLHHLFFPHVTVHYSDMGGKINNHDLDHAPACASDQSVITTPEVPHLSAIMTEYKQQ